LGNYLRHALRDYLPAAMPTFWTEIDDMVCGLYHIEMVFNHQHGVPRIY
jgi:hypothetical protein